MRALQVLGQVLGRVLGVALLAKVAGRLPGRAAWWASLAVLVVVNLLPVYAVLRGAAGIGDVFLVYWLENVVVWATGVVRIATAEGTGGSRVSGTVTVNGRTRRVSGLGASSSAGFFALHYGIFTLVHGVFTLIIVAITGLTGGVWPVVLLTAAITVGHLVSLGLVWFGRGQRKLVSPGAAMWAPYPRMLVLHVAVIGGFAVVLGGPSQTGGLTESLGRDAGVAILCGLKTLVDVGFHLRLLRRSTVVEDGDELYGPTPA